MSRKVIRVAAEYGGNVVGYMCMEYDADKYSCDINDFGHLRIVDNTTTEVVAIYKEWLRVLTEDRKDEQRKS